MTKKEKKVSRNYFKDKTILITGGTGSFGKMFVDILQKTCPPKKLIVFSRDELKQFEMRQQFDQPNMRYFIGDIRDRERLHRAFHNVDIVVHAAALKQVPACEYNPFEAVNTNILGAENIINVAIDNKVDQVLALSTDKAANPINLYGATKLCSDKLFIAGNAYSGDVRTRFSVVRYGNVIGSRGSVIPYFKKMKETGTIPITDERMTRFWITLEKGVEFVLDSIEMMKGGELFIPKIPSMNIMDLKEAIAPECNHEIVGIRPGEKLHEVLLPNDEVRNAFELDNMYVLEPSFNFWDDSHVPNKKRVADDFEYASNNNPQLLTVEELRELIDDVEKVVKA